ncbi:MAG TPA: Hsp20/alpha crystallin family protein [Candidatus Dormibacteraeota bacterium]|jgi:HSP20 family protein|nr:Hsp20/alpha crystallin family protein [Candidatus Dormibacteraeota bacterium]
MAMTVWQEMSDLERRMDELLSAWAPRWALPAFSRLGVGMRGFYLPPMDAYERDGNLVVSIELPGIDPKQDVQVLLEGNELVVRGERHQRREVEEAGYRRQERCYGRFERRLPVPEGTQESAIQARYDRGVLEVTVKGAGRRAASEAKQIPVTVAQG